jgi:hypothetical protein
MFDRDPTTYPSFARYSCVANTVFSLTIRDRRNIFHLIRTNRDVLTSNTFFPAFGLTIAEFALFYALHEGRKKKKKRKAPLK